MGLDLRLTCKAFSSNAIKFSRIVLFSSLSSSHQILSNSLLSFSKVSSSCQRQPENVDYHRKGMSFFADQHAVGMQPLLPATRRLEARQVLIYQCISDLTGENGKYNYPRAAHLYPPFSDISCPAKNYKIAPTLTTAGQLDLVHSPLGLCCKPQFPCKKKTGQSHPQTALASL